MDKYKYVCCVGSVHALLLFFLINVDASVANTVFFLPKNGGIQEIISKKMLYVYWISRGGLWRRICNYYRMKYLFYKMNINSIDRYGFDEGGWTEYMVHTTKSFNLIEDGMNNYIMLKSTKDKYQNSIIHRILLHTPFMHIPYGLSKNISTIYLTGIDKIPQEIQDKARIVDMELLWRQCVDQRKQNILDLFGVNPDVLDLKDRSVLIITQPLSEDNIMAESEKIEVYKNVIKQYGERNVLIKPHPREKTNYEKKFPNALVLKSYFPIELLALSGQNLGIRKVITVYSTAIALFKNYEQCVLGDNAHPNLSFLKSK